MTNRHDDEHLGSFYMGRMRPPPKSTRRIPAPVLVILTVAAFAAIIWYAYPDGSGNYSVVDVPVVKADTTPFKTKPENPGGMKIPHQDSTVFDPLQKEPKHQTENLLPPPEKPVNKQKAIAKSDSRPLNSKMHSLDLKLEDQGNGVEKVVQKPVERPPHHAAPKKEISKKEASKKETPKKTAVVASSVTAPKIVHATPAPKKPVTVKKAPVPQKHITVKDLPVPGKHKAVVHHEAKKTVAKVAGGTTYVQLGAFRDPDSARHEWERLKKKFPHELRGLSMRTEKVHTASGTLTRLQAGRMSKTQAEDTCRRLKAAGSGCIVVK